MPEFCWDGKICRHVSCEFNTCFRERPSNAPMYFGINSRGPQLTADQLVSIITTITRDMDCGVDECTCEVHAVLEDVREMIAERVPEPEAIPTDAPSFMMESYPGIYDRGE